MEIIPAIIPEDLDDLGRKIALVDGLTEVIQIDITDGMFVPSKSWPFNDRLWNDGVRAELPYCDQCEFEFDLMVNNPKELAKEYDKLGAKRVIVHVESFDKKEDLDELIDRADCQAEVGLAFNIDTPLDDYLEVIKKVSFVQIMGIKKIGFQGQKFSTESVDKVRELKRKVPGVVVSVDGGVNLENAKLLSEAGVDRLVSGSSIYESGDIEETIKKFQGLS